jgi:urease accessory protein
MIATDALLLGLQLADSFFPSGATAHSFGLEGLHVAGELRSADEVERFLQGQIEERWASSDRVALMHAHAAGADLSRVAAIDEYCDRSTLVGSWRTAGRRLGRAQLALHAQLETPLIADYRSWVDRGRAPGQGCAVQGLVGYACGLSARHTAALSVHGLAVSIVGAALRLGAIGHVDAQRILLRQRAESATFVDAPLPALDDLGAWVPAAEIASMALEARRGRLFAS